MTTPPSVSEPELRTHHTDGGCAMKIMEAELGRPLPAVSNDGRYQRLWVLARLHSEPIGTCIVDLHSAELPPERFGEILWREFGAVIARRFTAAGLPAPTALDSGGLHVAAELWPFLRDRSEVLEKPPLISVVVCTYNRLDRLRVCLRHLQRQQYPAFEVVIVDNSPQTDAVKAHVMSLRDPRYRYVVEPRTGLSRARNKGTSVASGDVVAFLDDDEEPDAFWLAALARGFARASDIGCVTGLILPACLDTEAQVFFQQVGGHSKDHGFEPAIFSPSGPQSPLYPRPAFGAGGNMAFRREVLTKIGRFDTALGAGTPALGAEDTMALSLVLLSGGKIAYEPAAFVRHHDYSNFADLAVQQRGYMVGLGAFYAALLVRQPRLIVDLMKLLPSAVSYLRSSPAQAHPAATMVPQLSPGWRVALLAGPVAYVKGIIRNAST